VPETNIWIRAGVVAVPLAVVALGVVLLKFDPQANELKMAELRDQLQRVTGEKK